MRDRALLGASALLFAASAAVTMIWCGSMSAMPGMEMPGGWTMSMAWMRMPDQSWSGAAVTFLGMWTVMMIAMMLPSLVPMLARYRQHVKDAPHRDRLTWIAGAGYFLVWILAGAIAYPLGVILAKVAMQTPALARAVPIATAVIIVVAGVAQFTAWKARQLARCRESTGCCRSLSADAGTAWQHGIALGVRCVHCCLGPTAILLVCGVMDLRAMAMVTAAVAAERLSPDGNRVARLIGALALTLGLILIAGDMRTTYAHPTVLRCAHSMETRCRAAVPNPQFASVLRMSVFAPTYSPRRAKPV